MKKYFGILLIIFFMVGANDFIETNYDDDVAITFGTSTAFKQKYDSGDTRLEWLDGADNVMAHIEDGGTTGTLTMTGGLALPTGAITDGAFTPTLSAGVNVASSASLSSFYMRMGTYVMYEISVSITPTAGTTYTTFELDLPIASNLGAAADAKGEGTWFISTTTAGACWVQGVAANDTIEVRFISASTSAHVVHATVLYKII